MCFSFPSQVPSSSLPATHSVVFSRKTIIVGAGGEAEQCDIKEASPASLATRLRRRFARRRSPTRNQDENEEEEEKEKDKAMEGKPIPTTPSSHHHQPQQQSQPPKDPFHHHHSAQTLNSSSHGSFNGSKHGHGHHHKQQSSIYDAKETSSFWEAHLVVAVVANIVWPAVLLLISIGTMLVVTWFRLSRFGSKRILRRPSIAIHDGGKYRYMLPFFQSQANNHSHLCFFPLHKCR